MGYLPICCGFVWWWNLHPVDGTKKWTKRVSQSWDAVLYDVLCVGNHDRSHYGGWISHGWLRNKPNLHQEPSETLGACGVLKKTMFASSKKIKMKPGHPTWLTNQLKFPANLQNGWDDCNCFGQTTCLRYSVKLKAFSAGTWQFPHKNGAQKKIGSKNGVPKECIWLVSKILIPKGSNLVTSHVVLLIAGHSCWPH